MTLAEFKRSVSKVKPPPDLAPALAALWWEAKGDWDRAHGLVMDEGGKDCAWVHAICIASRAISPMRRYWYAQAGKSPPSGPLRGRMGWHCGSAAAPRPRSQ